MHRVMTVLAATLALAGCATLDGEVRAPRVAFETEAGLIVMELFPERAPVTVCNFLTYVQADDFDGGSFFRTVVRATNTGNPNPIDVIQAATPRGSDDASRPPIVLERTRDTGLRHVAGAVSMARDGPDTATSSFFIVTYDTPGLDFGGARNPDGQGFAVFAQVIQGLDVARRIQASPADAGEQLTPPVAILSAQLIDGVPAVCR